MEKKEEISKEAKEGFELVSLLIEQALDDGVEPDEALELLGINKLEKTFFLLTYLREYNQPLYKRLTPSQ